MSNTRVLIVFYSRSGVTEALAKGIAEGATKEGAEVRLRRAREFVGPEVMAQAPGWKESAEAMNARYPAPTADDAAWADAIVFGTPTRFGNASAELKAYIDSLGALWFGGKLNNKVGAVFGSSSSPHGGNETTLVSLYAPLAHLGLLIVPTGYLDPSVFKAGSPYGATSVSANQALPPTADDLEVAQWQGKRVTWVAKAIKAAGLIATA